MGGNSTGRALTLTAAAFLACLAISAEVEAQEPQERLSPLDSTTAVVQGAEIEVQYGRPSIRDRTIFGGLVPWDEVWRTGANEATHLRTSADLRVGDVEIPAGHYTLYTIPRQDGWTLVVNQQTGQWGTEYDAERDLARIEMRVEELRRPVETFTIHLDSAEEAEGTLPADADGVLRLEWETTRAWVGFEVLTEQGAGGNR